MHCSNAAATCSAVVSGFLVPDRWRHLAASPSVQSHADESRRSHFEDQIAVTGSQGHLWVSQCMSGDCGALAL